MKKIWTGHPEEIVKQMQESSWFGEKGVNDFMKGVALRGGKWSGEKIRYDNAENLLGDQYGEK
jgi:hypothetical protein